MRRSAGLSGSPRPGLLVLPGPPPTLRLEPSPDPSRPPADPSRPPAGPSPYPPDRAARLRASRKYWAPLARASTTAAQSTSRPTKP